MILRVLIAASLVVLCYFFPSQVDSEYTDLSRLRENTRFSAALVCAVLFFVRGWTAICLSIIEGLLITGNFYLAINWDLRETLFIGINYSLIQSNAFYLELAIIALRLLIGLRRIGAELDDFNNRIAALTRSSINSERNK